jgi:hypothetical protein
MAQNKGVKFKLEAEMQNFILLFVSLWIFPGLSKVSTFKAKAVSKYLLLVSHGVWLSFHGVILHVYPGKWITWNEEHSSCRR